MRLADFKRLKAGQTLTITSKGDQWSVGHPYLGIPRKIVAVHSNSMEIELPKDHPKHGDSSWLHYPKASEVLDEKPNEFTIIDEEYSSYITYVVDKEV